MHCNLMGLFFLFQSQGRFFGGCCFSGDHIPKKIAVVSIAGAILWGVLRPPVSSQASDEKFQSQGRFFGGCCGNTDKALPKLFCCFNRRGDSLGGAAIESCYQSSYWVVVSIAGAILWGVLPRLRPGPCFILPVSIAGAILWGVLPGDEGIL